MADHTDHTDTLLEDLMNRMEVPDHLKSSAITLLELSLNNTATILRTIDKEAANIATTAAMKDILKRIINDLPQNRDWLDPNIEKIARELIK